MMTGVIGSGAWGTTISALLAERQKKVILWCNEEKTACAVNNRHKNPDYLPDISLPDNIEAVTDMKRLEDCGVIIFAVPSQFVMNVIEKMECIADGNKVLLILTKGFARDEGSFFSEIFSRRFAGWKINVLSGPNIAMEIAQKKPGSSVIAGKDSHALAKLQNMLFRDYFRVYTSNDIIGVQIGGAYKNIIAIGGGISDSIGYGINTKAAFLTRGLVEMRRFGIACGADSETFSGLSGVGDLIATANSPLSRNYSYGYSIVDQDKDPYELLSSSGKTVEGALAVRYAVHRGEQLGISLPIAETIDRIIYHGLSVREAIHELMSRNPKEEIY